jgi:hypothetical protein
MCSCVDFKVLHNVSSRPPTCLIRKGKHESIQQQDKHEQPPEADDKRRALVEIADMYLYGNFRKPDKKLSVRTRPTFFCFFLWLTLSLRALRGMKWSDKNNNKWTVLVVGWHRFSHQSSIVMWTTRLTHNAISCSRKLIPSTSFCRNIHSSNPERTGLLAIKVLPDLEIKKKSYY